MVVMDAANWKRWKFGTYIPITHEPGEQKGYMMGKQRHQPSSEHHSQSTGSVVFYKVGYWAGGKIKV